MFKNSSNIPPSCSSGADIVSFLYDEMEPAERTLFEDHLSDCENCAAELAGISFARLDVYEWHRDEFVAMATPRIEIAYSEASSRPWTEIIRTFFTSPARFATAGAALAVVALGSLWLSSPDMQDIAVSVPVPSPLPAESRSRPSIAPALPEPGKVIAEKGVPASPRSGAPLDQPKTVKAAGSSGVRTVVNSERKAGKTKSQPARAAPAKPAAPPLDDFDDFEDDTLRLGDLLADVGS